MDSSVKEPEISSGSLDVVVAASELTEAIPGASYSEHELPQFDCAAAQVDYLGGEVDAGDVLPDAGDIVASSDSSASADEDSDDDDRIVW